MLARNVLLGGMAALGARALLVVPEMEVESVDDALMSIQPIPFEDITYGVLLPCTNCPFREVDAEGVVSWSDDKPSSLVSLTP